MKVRIGNDIKVKLQLKFVGVEDQVNILAVRVLFVNTTLKDLLHERIVKNNRFVNRFPVEPCLSEFEPTECCINSCGNPRYHAYVYNRYNGFGVNPDWKNIGPVKKMDITEYPAHAVHTVEPDTITAIFPAEAQKFTGMYEIVIIAKVFDPEYKDNWRTVTKNISNAFELVASDSEDTEAVGDSVMVIVNDNMINTSRLDDYVESGTYQDGYISLHRALGQKVDINVNGIAGWYDETEPEDNNPTTPSSDDYVESGAYRDGYISLYRKLGDRVDINVGEITSWYEDYGEDI